MAAPLRVLGAHLRKKVCAAEVVPPKFSVFLKRSFHNRIGIWIADSSGLNRTDSPGLNNIPLAHGFCGQYPSMKFQVQRNCPNFRLIASTRCNLGGSGPITTNGNGKIQGNSPRMIVRPISTNEKMSLVHTGATPRYIKTKALVEKIALRLWINFWKSLEEDFVKKVRQYVAGGLVVGLAWSACTIMSALGLDVGILDKLRGHERVQSEENKIALKILAEILERKDRRLKLLEEENKKIREESERARQVHKKEASELEEEVQDLKAAIHALQERGRGIKTKEGSEKAEQSEPSTSS